MSDLSAQCRQKRDMLLKTGHVTDALLVVEHAILRLPNDTSLLLDYTSLVMSLIEKGEPEERKLRLESLENFVRGRVPHVDFEQIDSVLRCADEIAKTRTIGDTSTAPEAIIEPPLLKDARTGRLDTAPPEDETQVETWLQALEEALAIPDEKAEHKPAKLLEDAIKLARLAREFDSTIKDAEAIVAMVNSALSSPRAPYLLQHAEGQVRPFLIEAEKLSTKRQGRLKQFLQSLREQSDTIAKRSRDADAKRAWEAFEREHKDKIETLSGWSAPRYKTSKDGICQLTIESAKKIAQALQEVMPLVQMSAFSPKMTETANTLNDVVLRASNAQQTLYNNWALQEIRTGFNDGKKHTGVIDNEPALGDSMIARFGPIDVRLLNQEVQRCYSEVFELLYQKLDSPSDPKDFDKRGSKLFVLARMMQATKIQLSEF